MINLQQYYLEEYEIKRARRLPNLDLRFSNKVVSVQPEGKARRCRWRRRTASTRCRPTG